MLKPCSRQAPLHDGRSRADHDPRGFAVPRRRRVRERLVRGRGPLRRRHPAALALDDDDRRTDTEAAVVGHRRLRIGGRLPEPRRRDAVASLAHRGRPPALHLGRHDAGAAEARELRRRDRRGRRQLRVRRRLPRHLRGQVAELRGARPRVREDDHAAAHEPLVRHRGAVVRVHRRGWRLQRVEPRVVRSGGRPGRSRDPLPGAHGASLVLGAQGPDRRRRPLGVAALDVPRRVLPQRPRTRRGVAAGVVRRRSEPRRNARAPPPRLPQVTRRPRRAAHPRIGRRSHVRAAGRRAAVVHDGLRARHAPHVLPDDPARRRPGALRPAHARTAPGDRRRRRARRRAGQDPARAALGQGRHADRAVPLLRLGRLDAALPDRPLRGLALECRRRLRARARGTGAARDRLARALGRSRRRRVRRVRAALGARSRGPVLEGLLGLDAVPRRDDRQGTDRGRRGAGLCVRRPS